MHWNKKIGRFAKSSDEEVPFLAVAHDARDESFQRGAERLVRRWTV